MNVVHIKTLQEFNTLMAYLEEKGFSVCGGKPTDWDIKEDIQCSECCIVISDDGEIDYHLLDCYKEAYPGRPIQTVDEYISGSSVYPKDIISPSLAQERMRRIIYDDPVDLELSGWYQKYIEKYIKSEDYKLKDKSMEIVKFAKNLTLSKDEKLMRKQGLKDENGKYTDAYTEIVDNLIYSEYETKVLAIAKQKDEEERNK